MPQIITIYKPGGTTIKLGTSHPPVNIISATQEMSLMEEDKVDISVESASVLNIAPGDYITVFGRRYWVNSPPKVTKNGTRDFRYDITFEGAMYEMMRSQFLMIKTGFVQTPDFTFMGNLSPDFLALLTTNIQRASRLTTGFTTSAPTGTVVKNLTFSQENTLEVVNRLADEFEQEWYIAFPTESTCCLYFTTKSGTDLHATDIFYHMRGIRNITRNNVTSTPYCTRLYPVGSDKNLPSDYRDFSQRLLPTGTYNYIEDATAKAAYGLIEASKVWDDVYPTRTGTITSVASDKKTFVDTGMDFDLNSYLISGVAAKIHFQTGKLAGYEFTISSYTHSTKTFVIVPVTDERGLTVPNTTETEFQLTAGDTYKLLDIQLPASYVTTAENELLSKASAWLTANCKPVVNYDVEMDPYWIAANKHGRTDNNLYAVGDIIQLIDSNFGLNDALRILGFKRNVLKPYEYTFTLGDAPFRRPVYKMAVLLKSVIKSQKLAGLDDPANIYLKAFGDNYAQSAASGMS